MQAFILAGGFATRLWPLTEKRAKPLLPLAGKPLLSHLVAKVPEGIPITVSTNARFAQDMENWRRGIRNQESGITVVIEDAGREDEKLGAVGALARWIETERVDDDVLLLAGDNYLGFSLSSFLDRFQGDPLIAVHDIRDRERAKQLGTVIVVGDTVKAFEEKPREPKSTIVSTGCAVIPREVLPLIVALAQVRPDNVGGIFEHFLRQGITVRRVSFLEAWFDIGSFDSYLQATTSLVGDRTIKGRNATVNEGHRRGSVVLGDRTKVRRSTLCNVVVFCDCRIEDCVLHDCVIDDHCELRGVDLSGKMIRASTKLIRNS